MITKTAPAPIEDRKQLTVSYGLAGLFIIMALMQLLKFEAFVQVLVNQGITSQIAVGVAVSLLVVEIFALPFLLRLWLSNLARVASAICLLLAPFAWLLVGMSSTDSSIGLFGDFISLSYSSGLAFIFALVILSIWSFAVLKGATLIHLR